MAVHPDRNRHASVPFYMISRSALIPRDRPSVVTLDATASNTGPGTTITTMFTCGRLRTVELYWLGRLTLSVALTRDKVGGLISETTSHLHDLRVCPADDVNASISSAPCSQ